MIYECLVLDAEKGSLESGCKVLIRKNFFPELGWMENVFCELSF
jgi:hypothetical protein